MMTESMEMKETRTDDGGDCYRQSTEVVFPDPAVERPERADELNEYERQERLMALLLLGW